MPRSDSFFDTARCSSSATNGSEARLAAKRAKKYTLKAHEYSKRHCERPIAVAAITGGLA